MVWAAGKWIPDQASAAVPRAAPSPRMTGAPIAAPIAGQPSVAPGAPRITGLLGLGGANPAYPAPPAAAAPPPAAAPPAAAPVIPANVAAAMQSLPPGLLSILNAPPPTPAPPPVPHDPWSPWQGHPGATPNPTLQTFRGFPGATGDWRAWMQQMHMDRQNRLGLTPPDSTGRTPR